jgi:CheY-like chemotaxis protein
VLLNLAANAVKFTRTGAVTVRMAPEEAEPEYIRFEVIDTGVGITAEDCAGLFQPFTQVDSSDRREYSGTGLGLSISKRLVELMGGTIGVTSELGVGSTFWFRIPLRGTEAPESPAPVAAPEPARIEESTAQSTAPILVVEDNMVNQRVAIRLLERLGYSVEAACNGQQAVDMVLASEYSLVLMDCQMPVMDGLQATQEIRRNQVGRHTPIVALTARAMEDDEKNCLAAGMDGYMSKPVQLAQLSATVRRWSVPTKAAASASSAVAVPAVATHVGDKLCS